MVLELECQLGWYSLLMNRQKRLRMTTKAEQAMVSLEMIGTASLLQIGTGDST